MRYRCLSLSVLLVIAMLCGVSRGEAVAVPRALPVDLLELGWIKLFDGESLFGWKPTGEAKWEVTDGEIRTNGQQPGFLMSTMEWSDFELLLEFKAPDATNSGVFLRSAAEPQDPAKDCFELNIAPADNPYPTGSLVARQKAQIEEPPAADEWHTFRVTVWGKWITVELDGQRVADYKADVIAPIGFIALQSNSGPVAFRNIRLRPFELSPLLARGDLRSFNLERAEKSQFEVNEEKELHVTNGPGQIETKAEFANFVLQLQCKVDGKGLNSGVFFRTLREGRWAGYESQINNVYKDGDRSKPADFGTGGIYRRQPARLVMADDGEWLFKTIVADGPHMAVWVNGIQVSDWTDTRPEKESAREGLRLKPGVIAIQGHDPTTNFWFRDLRVKKLPR